MAKAQLAERGSCPQGLRTGLPLSGEAANTAYRPPGSSDPANFGRVAKIFVDPRANEAYIADDRVNDRIQVFRPDGTFVKEVFIAKNTKASGSVWDVAFSKDPQHRELFYLRSDGMLMAVAVRMGSTFQLGAVTPLFKTALSTNVNAYRMDYVPAADRQRFLMKAPIEGTTPPSITVVLNWTALLKK